MENKLIEALLSERVTWRREDKIALRKKILKFVEQNMPMVKRSDIVHQFAKEYMAGEKGVSRTYIYSVIKDMEKAGFLKSNPFDPVYVSLAKSLTSK